jgi:Membrane proteins related to metalloendopeptidases
VARGTLSLVGWNKLGGWRLWLTDNKGNSFYYAHLAGYARWILTHPHVRAGQVVGFLGRTGDAFTTTPHVHFEIHPHQPAFVKLDYDGAVDPTTYLKKWKIEHVQTDEIPQPARLKAPRGAPRQEAAVVWRELSSPATWRRQSRRRPRPAPPPAVPAPAELPRLRSLAATDRAGPAHVRARPASETDVPLLVGGPLGAVVALGGTAGAFVFRRRRRTASPPAEPSS